MNHRLKDLFALGIACLCLFLAPAAHACATCFGKSDSKLAEGMNWGIFTLLVVVLGVLGGISAFFIFLARRSSAGKTNVRTSE
jgi:heme/copper-type cytochrome/quinol oxidase subunit 2